MGFRAEIDHQQQETWRRPGKKTFDECSSFILRTHVSGGEGDDGGGALVAEDLVGDGRHGVHVGRRCGEVGAAESCPQEGRHPVSNKIEYKLKHIVLKMLDK